MKLLQLRLNVAGSPPLNDTLVSWDDFCQPDLWWWSDVGHLQAGLPLGPQQPLLFLFTDASDTGWGASLGDSHLLGSWSWDCSAYSINHWELLAVLFAVLGFLSSLQDRLISLYADNTTALSYLKKQGGTRPQTLNSVAHTILRLCEVHRIQLLPRFIPGKLNILSGFLEPQVTSPRLQVDSLLRGLSPTSSPLASHGGPLHHNSEPPSAGVLFTNGRSPVSGHGRYAPVVGRAPGVCLPPPSALFRGFWPRFGSPGVWSSP